MENNFWQRIHAQALRCARQHKKSEVELLTVIGQVDAKRVYLKFGYKSLFEYVTKYLKLSENVAYAFIRVSRKSVEFPEIKKAIEQGTLSLSHAKNIASVITQENKQEWIDKGETLSVRQLEQEIAKNNPHLAITEKLKPVAQNRVKLECGVDFEVKKIIQRAQDLLSQRKAKVVGLEEAISEVFKEFVTRHDPLEKKPRQLVTGKNSKALKLQVIQRDKGQCQGKDPDGKVCGATRFVDVHHVIPKSQGGKDELPNLILLCKNCHRLAHYPQSGNLAQGAGKTAGIGKQGFPRRADFSPPIV